MRISAPKHICDRRLANPAWVRRNRRSLGKNKQHRACIRGRKEMEKALAKMASEKESSLADRINKLLGQFMGRTAQIFTHRAQGRG